MLTFRWLLLAGFLTVVVLGVYIALDAHLTNMEARLMALNNKQQQELLDALAAIGTDVTELTDRLEASDADDPVVTEVIAGLRGLGERLDTIATTQVPPPTE